MWHPQYNDYTRSDDLRFRQDVPRHYDGGIVPRVPEGGLPETGDKDISFDQVPQNKFVLVRGLKPSVSEALFAKGK